MDYKRARAEINLSHLAANLKAVRGRVPKYVKLLASVKADAYGHGAAEVSKCLLEHGTDMLGVAICEEGLCLRENGIRAPILVMSYTPETLLDDVVKHNLIQTVYSADTAKLLAETAARHGVQAEVHIKVDTGMGRLGFLPDERSAEAICAIASMPPLKVSGIYSHLATSDALDNSFMYEQRERFQWMLEALNKKGLNIPMRHIMNSGALAQTLRADLREKPGVSFYMDMVRTGVMLYGLLPSADMAEACAPLSLKPVMRLITRVNMVKTLPVGSGVSYGHLFRTERDSVVATLPIGYADGYPRRLSNKARVLIKGRYAPVIGAVCMDQCMADVTGVPNVNPGDEVVMLGAQDSGLITADELADIVGTIGYEIVCGVGKRVPREYVE